MKKFALVLLFLIQTLWVYGQYNRPYRIIYEPDIKSYFVSNQGNGSITQIDANYRTKSVITGLTKPKDMATIYVGTLKLLLVIDNNRLKLYDSTFKLTNTFTISGATDAEDIELNPNDPRFFYISDVGGKIIKGKIGSAPFYTPSFSSLVTRGLNRPRGLLFNRDKELLVVTDEAKGKVIKVDTSNGNLTTMLSTSLDSLNSIAQDGQGNYYMTNWGDSYSYRCNSAFKKLTKQTGYNKPAGLVANVKDDLILITCYKCNKVEYVKFHYFEPDGPISACPGDSVDVRVSPLYKGVGTYDTGNRFVVELSDEKGSFSSPFQLGSVTTAAEPSEIKIGVPRIDLASGYKIRIKSLLPEHVSSAVSMTTLAWPDLGPMRDSTVICSGDYQRIGLDSMTNIDYNWTSAYIQDTTDSDPYFYATDSGYFNPSLTAKHRLTGCTSTRSVSVYVLPPLTFNNLQKTQEICIGDSVAIGTADTFSMEWLPGSDLSDSLASNPWFSGKTSTTKYVFGYEPSTGCFAIDSVQVVVHGKPQVTFADSTRHICQGESIPFTASTQDSSTIDWSPRQLFDTSQGGAVVYTPRALGRQEIKLHATSPYGCTDSLQATIINQKLPAFEPEYTYRMICEGAGNILLKAKALEDSVQFTWNPSNQFESAKGDSVYFVPDARVGRHEAWLIATGSNGCTDSANIWVNREPTPQWDSVRIVAGKFPKLQVGGGVNMTDSMVPLALYLYDEVSDSGWTDQRFDRLPADLQVQDTSILPTHAYLIFYSDSLCGAFSDRVALTWLTHVQERVTSRSRVYPNPVQDNIFISGRAVVHRTRVFTTTGTLVHESFPNLPECSIRVEDLRGATYVLEILYADGAVQRQLVLKH